MSGQIFTKSAYAKRIGVRPSAVSNYIARHKLTPPAIRPDGTIDAALADNQLDIRLETVRRAGQMSQRPGLSDPPAARSSAAVVDLTASRALLDARVTVETIRAERMRRDLNEERGRYMLTERAEAEWGRVLSAFLLDVETSFADLNYQIDGLDNRERLIAIRRWWRGLRQRSAARFRALADAEPEFVADPDVANAR